MDTVPTPQIRVNPTDLDKLQITGSNQFETYIREMQQRRDLDHIRNNCQAFQTSMTSCVNSKTSIPPSVPQNSDRSPNEQETASKLEQNTKSSNLIGKPLFTLEGRRISSRKSSEFQRSCFRFD